MAGQFPSAWQETCHVSIQKKGQAGQQFGAITPSVDISEPDYQVEGIAVVSGGRIMKQTAQEDGEVTLEIHPVDVAWMKGGVISSINGDGTTTTLSTSAAHGLTIGDTVRVSNSTNYGSTSSPVNYTVKTVTDSDTVTMLSSTSAAEETNGTWVGIRGNTSFAQQFVGQQKQLVIATIDGDADSVDLQITGHGLVVGDIIEVSGTTNYNGPYVIATVTDTNNVVCTDESHNQAQETVGFVNKIARGGQPIITGTDKVAGVNFDREKYMFAVLWTNDTAVVNATDVTAGTDFTGLRFYAKDCRVVSHKTAFTDGIVKTTLTLKFPAMNKAGTTRGFAWESTDDTDTSPLPALTYT